MTLNEDLMTRDTTVSITGNDVFTKLKNEIAYWDEYMSELRELVRWYEDLTEFGKTHCTIHHDLRDFDKIPEAPEGNKDRLVWSLFSQYLNGVEAELKLGNCYFIRPDDLPLFQLGSLMDMICSGADVRGEADLFTCEEPSEALDQLKSSEDYPDGFCKLYASGAEDYYEASLDELTEEVEPDPDPSDCDCSACTCEDCEDRVTDPDQAIRSYFHDENAHGDIVLDCSNCGDNPECPPDCPVPIKLDCETCDGNPECPLPCPPKEESPCESCAEWGTSPCNNGGKTCFEKGQEKEMRHVHDSSEVNIKDVLDTLQHMTDTLGVCNAIMKHIFNNHKDEFLKDFGQVVD